MSASEINAEIDKVQKMWRTWAADSPNAWRLGQVPLKKGSNDDCRNAYSEVALSCASGCRGLEMLTGRHRFGV
ncbi:hypothetical protein, partial [Burkholderia pseudomallei]|uniref:hypothetical protein n=1 Tax=Burkholderia pseudomallei TaxID=28450 RepID=UPI000A77BEA2